MVANGRVIGGEQAGHVILRKYATTGDGLLTAILLMERMMETKTLLSKLAEPVVMYPQVLINLRVTSKDAVLGDAEILAKLDECNARLGSDGRMLLRKSGTEPLVRVMVEAASQKICEQYAGEMADLIRSKGLAVN